MKVQESTKRTGRPVYLGCGARRLACVISALTLVIGVSSAFAQAKSAKPASKATTPIKAAASSPVIKVAAGSLLVYVDTKTLALNLEPGADRVALELSADMLNKLNTSGEGLTPVTENGMTRIDLKGRYQPVWVAVTDSKGALIPFCMTSLPAPVQAAAKAIREVKGGSHER